MCLRPLRRQKSDWVAERADERNPSLEQFWTFVRVIAVSGENSPLRNLAILLHQDFELMGMEPVEWGKGFINSLSADQRGVLKAELLELVAANPGKGAKGLRNAFIRLGATWCPRPAKVREMIGVWVEALE